MNNNLIYKIGKKELYRRYYNTACLQVTEGNDFKKVYNELIIFAEKTILEKGCIEFFVAPSSIENKEFMLWEVWEDPSFLNKHMQAKHTKEVLSKNLITLLWSNSANMKEI